VLEIFLLGSVVEGLVAFFRRSDKNLAKAFFKLYPGINRRRIKFMVF